MGFCNRRPRNAPLAFFCDACKHWETIRPMGKHNVHKCVMLGHIFDAIVHIFLYISEKKLENLE